MFGEYGYMEEGRLGKPYNLRLLKRLAKYLVPYMKTIGTAFFLTMLITLFDLAAPYLSKIAIDRYILSSWYVMDTTILSEAEARDHYVRYGHLLRKSRDGSLYLISHADLKRIDPADLHEYKSRKVLSSERLYRAGSDVRIRVGSLKKENDIFEMDDGSIMISYERLRGLPHGDILRIRAGDIR